MPNRKRVINEDARKSVVNFLSKLPKLPSHYCRASSEKEYLEPQFQSISELHRVYIEHDDKNLTACRQVFAEEFCRLNLGLFKPKKDECDTCTGYKVGNVSEEDYTNHVLNKEEARTEKSKDKKEAEQNVVQVFTMDVQAVQLVPYLKASALYFKQKLACHNFTLYNLANNEVICYVWHEGEAELNANVYTSCIIHFLEHEIDIHQGDPILYSDGCASQNRNVTLSNALRCMAMEKGITITQKYLEKGHTQMECDSAHAVIERRKKNREMYTPAHYVQVIREARIQKPYKVHYIDHNFCKNYSDLKYLSSIRPGIGAGAPQVVDIRCLQYLPSGNVQYKLRHTDPWESLPIPRKATRAGSVDVLVQLKPLYSSSLRIKKDKYNDLQALKSVIMSDFHGFYDNLPHVM